MLYSLLSDRTVIAISGEDRIAFLQGLITNDANLLAQGEALYAALLSPQGKFLHDFFLIPYAEQILLDINKNRAADLISRFTVYKLRSKVQIEMADTKVTALWDNLISQQPPTALCYPDPRLPALGWRVYGEVDISGATQGDYEFHRITLGVPDGAIDMHIDKSFLLEFDFERLHGVNFSKGCYVGQEVTARSKFRGQVRRQLTRISAEKTLPPLSTSVTSGDTIIGELRSSSGSVGLALLNIEALEKITSPLLAGDVEITVLR